LIRTGRKTFGSVIDEGRKSGLLWIDEGGKVDFFSFLFFEDFTMLGH
jgi:hypothetical protein